MKIVDLTNGVYDATFSLNHNLGSDLYVFRLIDYFDFIPLSLNYSLKMDEIQWPGLEQLDDGVGERESFRPSLDEESWQVKKQSLKILTANLYVMDLFNEKSIFISSERSFCTKIDGCCTENVCIKSKLSRRAIFD